MSLTTVRNKIDNWLQPRWVWLVGKQEDYFLAHGHYFQGLWTHSVPLEQTDALDGDTVPDNLDSHPTDQIHTWIDIVQDALDSLPLPARLRLDCYVGPHGHGWIAKLEVLYQGNLYSRAKQVGPDSSFEYPWRLDNFEPPPRD